jgi:ligand-binding sensor domain-containing protein
VWLLQDNEKLIKYDGKKWSTELLPDTATLDSQPRVEFARDGSIWFMQSDGIFNYKNKRWTVYYNTAEPFNKDRFHTMFVDSNNRVWVAGHRTLYCLQSGDWHVYKDIYTEHMVLNDVEKITEDDKGHVWVSDYSGYLKYFDGKDWVPPTWGKCNWTRGIVDLTIKWDSLIVGGRDLITKDTCIGFNERNSPMERNQQEQAVEVGEFLWLATYTDFFKYVGGKLTPVNLGNSPFAENEVNDIKIDPSGVPYVVVEGTIYKYVDQSFIQVSSHRNEDVSVIEFDSNGTLYAGSKYFFKKLEGGKWQEYPEYRRAFGKIDVKDIEIAEDGTIWVANRDGFAKFKGGVWEVFTREKLGLEKLTVNRIETDADGDAWIATSSGVIEMTGGAFKIHNQYFVPGTRDMVMSMNYNKSKGELWMGKVYPGIIIHKEISKLEYQYQPDVSEKGFNQVVDIEFDQKENVWVATRTSGIFYYDGRRWYTVKPSGLQLPHDITCMALRNNDELWIGSQSYGLIIITLK